MIEIPKISKLSISVPKSLLEILSNLYFNNINRVEKKPSIPYKKLSLQENKSSKWQIINSDTEIINKFLEDNFNSAMGFRLHMWETFESTIEDVGHDYPRVFIPVTNDHCIYSIMDGPNKYSLNFKIGNCYVWDVRFRHSVMCVRPEVPRLVGIFLFDPKTETKCSFT